MTIYVHIGYPKVASTTIQGFLAQNHRIIAKHGLVYPRIANNGEEARGRPLNNHNMLATDLTRGTLGLAWQRLHQAIKDHPNIILSAEGLVSCNPRSLQEALGPHEVQIIVYLRQLSQVFPSLYAQITKFGFNLDDFDAFLDTRYIAQYFDIPSRLIGFADVFGAHNIKVRLLDKRALVGGDVRTDILAAADVDGVDPSTFRPTKDQNVSPDWKTLEIWRDISTSLAGRLIAQHGKGAVDKARSARLRRQRSPLYDFAAAMEPACTAIGKSLGWTDRGRYVSQGQFEAWERVFDTAIDQLKAAGMRLSFEVAEFMRRFSTIGIWSLLSGEKRMPVLFKSLAPMGNSGSFAVKRPTQEKDTRP